MRRLLFPAAFVGVVITLVALLGGRARAPGAGPTGPASAWNGPSSAELLAALRGDREITGRVLGADGLPAPGATVEAIGADLAGTLLTATCDCEEAREDRLLSCADRAAAERLASLLPGRRGEPPVVARATADADGRFRLPGLAGGAFHLWAARGEELALAERIAAGGDVELQLAAGSILPGRTLLAEAEPLPGVSVFAIHLAHGRVFETASGADGSFRLGPLPPGPFRLIATRGDLAPLSREVTLPVNEPLTLTLGARLRLEGTVLRAGRPVAGALVTTQEPGRRLAATGADGRFRLDDLSEGSWSLTASAGEEVAVQTIRIGRRLQPAPIRLELGHGVTVLGRVGDRWGRPIPRAKVDVECEPSQVARVRIACDEAGAFRTPPLAPGRCSFFATAPGFSRGAVIERSVVEPGTTVELELAPEAAARGVVVDTAGRPVAGAKVLAIGDDGDGGGGRDSRAEATSGADGRFAIPTLAPGSHRLVVQHDAHPPASETIVLPASELRVVLQRGRRLVGRVLGEGDAPLPGVAVELSLEEPAEPSTPRFDRKGRSDALGGFAFEGLVDGAYLATAVRGRQRLTRSLRLSEAAPPSVDLRLGGGLELRGTVEDTHGTPIAQARVAVVPASGTGGFDASAERRFQLVESAADGGFTASGLEPGAYSVEGSTRGKAWRKGSVKARAGDVGVRLVLPAPRSIAGRVVEPDGAPVTSFEVDGAAVEDPEGRFDHPVARSDGADQPLTVLARGFAPATLTVRLTGDGVTRIPDVVLSPGRTLVGRVVAANGGGAVAGASIVTSAEADSARPGLRGFGWSSAAVSVLTLADGTFRLENAPPGPFKIAVSHPRHAPLELTVPPGAVDLTLTLPAAASIHGSVTGADGRPVAGLRIELDGPTHGGNPVTGPDGRFEFDGLAPGRYLVGPLPQERTGADLDRFGIQVAELAEGERRQVDFSARSDGTTLRVTLLEAGGAPAQALGILAEGERPLPAPGVELDTFLRTLGRLFLPAAPKADGPLEFRALPAGRYTLFVVRISSDDRPALAQVVELDGAQGTRDLQVRLPPVAPP